MASAPIPPSLHQTPSRPPSRQSTRIITPVRTDPNFVRPNADLRKTITQERVEGFLTSPANSTISDTPDAASRRSEKRKRSDLNGSQAHLEPNKNIMDLTQDSDHKNNKAKKTRKTRARKDSEFGLDNIELYFHQPVFSNGATTFTLEPDAEGQSQSGKIVELEPLYYKCRWCGVTYKKGEGTRDNLVKHRDGTANRAPCTHRANAIRAGAKLPLTAKEVAAAKEMVADKSGAFNFDPRILNQIIVMWLSTRTQAEFSEPSIKDNLIHDVWTTKGNRQAFMGILAAYVSENWEFKVIHLGLKYIAWTHKGKFLAVPFANIITKSMLHTKITQTTDSGSNNGTMAVEVD
ncbi:hypothetical protein Pst134EA_002813 [Puccinia striiformis f. sp. tritici]|uniref:hypothetical protein n=1 Tax=Puccinia striiformis f. sp. tritici TaxID=168172 RepID=UPI002008E1BB|nr:hypothetical protein Pst134EA_002813 [Puccinia striiformis f. sp. tritici]KAH9472190.1 hypothetical protein Pst134EA_002813 [Puccinia striiformis f. sp. tritici]